MIDLEEILKKKILLVEDDLIIAHTESKTLQGMGFQVDHVITGEAALDFTSQHTPDLILMDIDLGEGIDGIETAELILRKLTLPIVFFSNRIEKEIVEKTAKVTSYGFILKQSPDTVLFASINMAFKLHEANILATQKSTELVRTNEILKQTVQDMEKINIELMISRNEVVKIEKKYREFYENTYLGVVQITPEGKFLSLNPEVARFYGYENPQDMINEIKDVGSQIYKNPSDRMKFVEIMQKNRMVRDFEIPIIKRDGTEAWISLSSKSVVDEMGKVLYFHTNIEDITEKINYMNTLNQKLEYHSVLHEVMLICLNTHDLDDLLQHVMQCTLKLLKFDGAGVYLLENNTDHVWLESSVNLPSEFLEVVESKSVKDHPADLVFTKGESLFIDHMEKFLPVIAETFSFKSFASLPLKNNQKVFGCLNVVSTSRFVFSETDKEILNTISSELATAVKRIIREKEIELNYENFHNLFNNISDLVIIVDQEGLILYVNKVVKHDLEYSSEELLGLDIVNLYEPEMRKEAKRQIKQVIAGEMKTCCLPIKAKSGKYLDLITNITTGIWNGNPAYYSISRNVTDEKKTEARLKELVNTYDLTIKGANIGTWDWNIVNGNVTYNKIWTQMLGYEHAEIASNVQVWEDLMHPDDREEVMRVLSLHLEDKLPVYKTEHRLKMKSGEWKWVLDIGQIFERDANNKPVRALGIHIDIDAQKMAQERYKTLLVEMQHRVKNSLTLITSLISLQAHRTDNPTLTSFLQELRSRIMSISNLYTILYRTEKSNEVDLKQYLGLLVDYLRMSYLDKTKNINITITIPEIMVEFKLASSLGIIVNELVTNSLKHAFPNRNDGRISVQLRKAKDNLILTIEDNGVGLSAKSSIDKSEGLGMNLVKLLTGQHKGSYTIYSEQETIFIITIPVDQSTGGSGQ